MNPEEPAFVHHLGFPEVVPDRAVRAPAPDVALGDVAEHGWVVAVDLQDGADRPRLGKADLPPPAARALLAFPRGALVDREALAVAGPGRLEARDGTGCRGFGGLLLG